MKHLTCTIFFVSILVLIGCNRNVPLTGKVTFADDGTPVPTGLVVFSTPKFIAQGPISEDGTYMVGSTGIDDGLPRDTYAVTILGADSVTYSPGPNGSRVENHTPLIDAKYKTAETSGLTFTVDGKNSQFDIKVDRPPARRGRR